MESWVVFAHVLYRPPSPGQLIPTAHQTLGGPQHRPRARVRSDSAAGARRPCRPQQPSRFRRNWPGCRRRRTETQFNPQRLGPQHHRPITEYSQRVQEEALNALEWWVPEFGDYDEALHEVLEVLSREYGE